MIAEFILGGCWQTLMFVIPPLSWTYNVVFLLVSASDKFFLIPPPALVLISGLFEFIAFCLAFWLVLELWRTEAAPILEAREQGEGHGCWQARISINFKGQFSLKIQHCILLYLAGVQTHAYSWDTVFRRTVPSAVEFRSEQRFPCPGKDRAFGSPEVYVWQERAGRITLLNCDCSIVRNRNGNNQWICVKGNSLRNSHQNCSV